MANQQTIRKEKGLIIADSLCKEVIKDKETLERHKHVSDYGIKLLDKFSKTSFPKDDYVVCIRLHDIIDYVDITRVESLLGPVIADLVFRTTIFDDHDGEPPLRSYETSMRSYDEIYLKLIIRASKIYCAVMSDQEDVFQKYICEYSELRRKTLKVRKEKQIRQILDCEAELIKFGRRRFEGKPAESYSYFNMILPDGKD